MKSLMEAIIGSIELISSEKEGEISIHFASILHPDLIKYMVRRAKIVVSSDGNILHSKHLIYLETKQREHDLLVSFDTVVQFSSNQSSTIRSVVNKGNEIQFIFEGRNIRQLKIS